MKALVRPFQALRPRPQHAADVVAPPYDVVSTEEARALAERRPSSFLHVSRPEIDLPAGTDPYSDAVYAQGARSLAHLQSSGVLVRESAPAYYVYRMRLGAHEQTGVACVASVAAYEADRIRKHELTRPEKENDRVRNITALNAQTGPVLCAYRAEPQLTRLLERAKTAAPLFEVEGPNEVEHAIWRITDEDAAALDAALNALGTLYIADGHHRSAAAMRVAQERRAAGGSPEDSHEYFLTVAFPHDAMRILDYNRTVAGLNGHTPDQLLERLGDAFEIEIVAGATRPDAPTVFSMYLDGRWFRMKLLAERIPTGDPVAELDVALLQAHIIEPLLGITEPRTDPRIDFVGGVRGLEELERRVDGGRASVAFALHPTRMEQLMAVADARLLMPPKSTWFEPKLADGLLSHVLD